MNFTKLLILLVLFGVLAVGAVFLIRQGRGDLSGSPYHDLAVMRKLPYEQGLRLRGEARVPGQDQFDQAMEFYAGDEFKRASGLLRQALKQQPDSSDWWLYYGICLYMNQEAKDAVVALGKSRDLGGPQTQDHARWFLTQCRLLLGERDAAEELLDRLVKEKSSYAAEARDLLLKLRKTDPLDTAGRPAVNNPTGRERYLTGREVAIRWSFAATPATRYRVMLSTDDGVTFPTTLAQGVAPNTNEWIWSTGGVQGNRLRVRVDAVMPDSAILGVASEAFSADVAPWIEITEPVAGARLRAGLDYDVRWKLIGAAPFSYKLELEKRVGSAFEPEKTICSYIDGAELATSWYNSSSPAPGYRLRLIAQYTDTSLVIVSKGDYEVLTGVAVYMASLDDEIKRGWRSGMPLNVAWQIEGDAPRDYTIELCDSLGEPRQVLESNLHGSATAWTWQQANVSGSYMLKLTAHYPEGELIKFTSATVADTAASAGSTPSTSSAQQEPLPGEITLEQNFPNPFNSTTMIRFTLGQAGPAKLTIYNQLGQLVRTIADESMPAGAHTVQFDATGLASGTYLYSLEANGRQAQKRLVLIK